MADIVTSACDIALVVSPGRVVESVMVNPQFGSAERFAAWQGARLSQLFSPESAQKLENRLADGPEPGRSLQLELTHAADAFTLPVRYTITRSGEDGTLLLIGRDMQPLAEVQQQLVKAQLALERDYEAQREIETRYRVLLEAHPAPLLIVSMSTGRIADLNLAAAAMIGATRAELIDAPVGQAGRAPPRRIPGKSGQDRRVGSAGRGRADDPPLAPQGDGDGDAVPRGGRPAAVVPSGRGRGPAHPCR
ncbi:hypothetical protein ACTTAK_03560 [Rhodobacter capsulatus]|uniref:hypothetical protein n=1 Tax=Rhodobacter capsulatus TaxID=1061 RepID=UPI004029F83D